MTTTAQKPDHRSLPRKKHPPTDRDQAIYVAYRSQGLTQEQLAEDHKVSQRRVSQIIQRVQRWLSGASTCNTELETCNSHDQLQPLERDLQRERSQAVFDRALRAHDQGIQTLKTTKRGKRGDTSFEETVTREVLPSPQHLRTAIQASRHLGKIADKPAPPPVGWAVPTIDNSVPGSPLGPHHPEAPASADTEDDLWQQTVTALYRARQKAEDERKVTKGHGHLDYLGTVQHWLDALLGNRPDYFHPHDSAPGTPLHELATFYYGRPRSSDPAQQRETCNLEPEASNASNPSTASNQAPEHEDRFESELQSASPLTPRPSIHNRKSKIQNPLPRPLPYQLDDYGYVPSPPPTKEEDAQMVKDYLAKLRAERLANA